MRRLSLVSNRLAAYPKRMDAISVQNLTKRYKHTLAVDNISFTLPQGGVLGLLGGNGAGKTTTISMLLGLLVPSTGSITVLGHDMAKDRFAALARMNFPRPISRCRKSSRCAKTCGFTAICTMSGTSKAGSPSWRINSTLANCWNRQAGELSAGQKTRVALAKSLINKPDLLLLDEPTASLDPDTGDFIRTALETYAKETGAAILLASHNMAEVERLCDDVLMLKSGRVVDQGTPAALVARYGREDLEQVFLGYRPQYRHRSGSLPNDGLAAAHLGFDLPASRGLPALLAKAG